MNDNALYTNAMSFINCQIKGRKMIKKTFDGLDVQALSISNKIHIAGLRTLCNIVNFQYSRDDWDGNTTCNSDWDIVYFDYKGFRFFELVGKEDK